MGTGVKLDDSVVTIPIPKNLPSVIRGFWFWIVVSSLVTLSTTYYYRHFLQLRAYPFGNPWFQKYSYQFDFNCQSERIKYFHQAEFFHQNSAIFNYPPVLALVYRFFYLFQPHAHTLFIATLVIAFGTAALLFAQSLIRHGVAVLTASLFVLTMLVTSHPLGVLFYLANMEGIVWIVTSLGLYAFVKDRKWVAACCFGLAGAMKIFPIIYLGLLLKPKHYNKFMVGVGVCIAINVLSLAVLGPTIAIASRGLAEGIREFTHVYVYHWNEPESSMDHSLFSLIKTMLRGFGRLDLLSSFGVPYLIAVAITGVTLYLAVIRRLPTLNLLMALAIASVLLPQVSHDYTLVQLYAPWALLTLVILNGHLSASSERGTRYMMGCFVILFTSQNYLIRRGVGYAGQVETVALLVLFLLTVIYPLRSELDEQVVGENSIKLPLVPLRRFIAGK